MSNEEVVLYTGFEGAEKKIEVCFRPDASQPNGLRSVLPQMWQSSILDMIHCTIIGATNNAHFDSYVLSESSLFVYPYKVILKTCGTTTLLHAIQPLIELAKAQCNLVPDSVFFSRKNFKFPERQLSPHTSLEEEITELNKVFNGHMYTFGPQTGEHWVMYYAEFSSADNQVIHSDQTLEILMEDLDPEVMQQFYRNRPGYVSAAETTRTSGIADLLPGAVTDEKQFEPCGYSVNGLLDESYFTIHITPEPECSFVSFETNVSYKDYTALINKVVKTFKPGRWTVTLFADADSESGPSALHGFDTKALEREYAMTYKSYAGWVDVYDYSLVYASYAKKTPQAPAAIQAAESFQPAAAGTV